MKLSRQPRPQRLPVFPPSITDVRARTALVARSLGRMANAQSRQEHGTDVAQLPGEILGRNWRYLGWTYEGARLGGGRQVRSAAAALIACRNVTTMLSILTSVFLHPGQLKGGRNAAWEKIHWAKWTMQPINPNTAVSVQEKTAGGASPKADLAPPAHPPTPTTTIVLFANCTLESQST